MPRIEVRVRYFAHDVWVLPELLGSTLELTRDDVEIRIRLPKQPSDFQPSPGAAEVEPTPACYRAPTFTDPTGPQAAVVVRLFAVSVIYAADVSDRQPDPIPDGFFEDVQRLASPGIDIAENVAHEFLRWLRVSCRQEWLGLSEERPAQYGRAGVLNADTGEALMGLGPTVEAVWRSAKLAIGADAWSKIAEALSDRADPPITDALLADARHMLQGADAPDAQRAVLVAAMACEIKAKGTVRALGRPEQRQLLGLVLKRVSNAPDLLDAPLAALGHASLRESDPDLGKALKALNFLRDRIVHAGVAVTTDEAWNHLLTAQRVFDWLNQLPPTGDQPSVVS